LTPLIEQLVLVQPFESEQTTHARNSDAQFIALVLNEAVADEALNQGIAFRGECTSKCLTPQA
jgi:ferredoxin